MQAFWKLVTMSMMPAVLPWPIAITSANRLAPAQNASGASLPITSATPSRSARSTAFMVMATMSGSMAFIFEWNSRQNTPSPMSSRDALPLRSSSPAPLARTTSSAITLSSAGTAVKPPRAPSCASLPGASRR